MKTKFITIFVTCGSKKEAKRITSSLLKKRLVACANIVSVVESQFWWKNKVDSATEVLVTLKTKLKNFRTIEKDIKRIHSYEVPEIIAIPILAGNREYLEWIDSIVSE